jgi:hypothetical protein
MIIKSQYGRDVARIREIQNPHRTLNGKDHMGDISAKSKSVLIYIS